MKTKKIEDERSIVKMILESLVFIIEEMEKHSSKFSPTGSCCNLKVHELKPSKVEYISSIEDIDDPTKVPLIIGDFSFTGNPSYLSFCVGISRFVINLKVKNNPPETISKSIDNEEYSSLMYPLFNFYNSCIVMSHKLCRKDIADEIQKKSEYISNRKKKNPEYDESGDTSRLEEIKKGLVEFDEKFSKYKSGSE